MTLWRTHKPSGPLVTGCCDIMIGRTQEGSLLRLFYPTEAKQLPSDEGLLTRWFLGEQYSQGIVKFATPSVVHTLASKLLTWMTRHSVVPSLWCGPLLGGATKLPVIVFSHGLSANRSLYSSVCSQLASHGFLVAALEHRDGSASSSFTLNDRGEREWIDFKFKSPGTKDFDLRSEQLATRVAECQRTLTVLEQLNVGVDAAGDALKDELQSTFDIKQLVNRLDLSRPIIAGHSFGGCTAIATAAKDDRFKLCVALDPWLFPMKNNANTVCPVIKQPLLSVSTQAFQSKENLSAMANLPDKTSLFVTIRDTVHQNQSDTPFLLGQWALMGTKSKLDPATAMDVNNALVLAFIHEHHGVPHFTVPPDDALTAFCHLVDCSLFVTQEATDSNNNSSDGLM